MHSEAAITLLGVVTKVYLKVSGLTAWSENFNGQLSPIRCSCIAIL
jgi:hypothetical protein